MSKTVLFFFIAVFLSLAATGQTADTKDTIPSDTGVLVKFCGFFGQNNEGNYTDSCMVEAFDKSDSSLSYEVISFTAVFAKLHGGAWFESCTGNRINPNSEIAKAIQSKEIGDLIIVTDVKVKKKGKLVRTIGPSISAH